MFCLITTGAPTLITSDLGGSLQMIVSTQATKREIGPDSRSLDGPVNNWHSSSESNIWLAQDQRFPHG
jgi:hypothetical protein